MARLLYAVTCMTLLFAISEGKTLFDVTTYSLGYVKRLEYTEHNLPSIQNKEIALSVESCAEVTIFFSQADVNDYQNMFAVTLGKGGISIKLGHSIHRLKTEYVFPHRIDMCMKSSVFIFSWKENTMRIFKQCSTNLFTRKLPRAGTNYSIRFITVTSQKRARWSYGDVCNGKHLAPPLPKNTGSKNFRTSKEIGFLSLTIRGINISPSFAFKVRGCGKLALTLHKRKFVLSFAFRYEIEIDNRAQSLTLTYAQVIGDRRPFTSLRTFSERRIGHSKSCSDFQTFRVKYSQNHLEFERCDGMSVNLLNFSSPDLSLYRYMSAYSDNQADWLFGVKNVCKNNRGLVTSMLPIPGTAGSVGSECSPKSGSSACTTNAYNRSAEGITTDWGSISNKTTGPATAVAPYRLVTGTVDDVIDIEETTMPGPSTSASSASSNSSSSNASSNNSSSDNLSSDAEQFQDGMEQISKALGSSGIDLASFTVNKVTLLVCVCVFATYPL